MSSRATLHRAGCAVLDRVPHTRTRQAALRRFDAVAYHGTAVECPLCESHFTQFKPAWNRGNAICWRCGAHERHRATWLYLSRHRPRLLQDADSLLHFAPEHCLETKLREVPYLRYLTGDLDPQLGELELDITDLALADASFDAILCSHVLEHVEADREAMRELYRVVRPGGWVLVMVPLDHTRTRTYEDPRITDPHRREEAFWQHDHVRLYAPDIADRLEDAGFAVRRERLGVELGEAQRLRYGLLVEDDVFLCRRPA